MRSKRILIHDEYRPKTISGRVQLWSSPADKDWSFDKLLFEGNNLVVADANTIMAQLLQRNFADYMPFYIVVGDGGDLEQAAKVDTGGRVAPAITDDEIRSVVARLPIIQVTSTPVTSPSPSPSPESTTTMWSYVAAGRPHEALSTSINELGVETLNGTLFSHFVTEAGDDGRARKYVKTSLEWLIVRWTFSLEVLL